MYRFCVPDRRKAPVDSDTPETDAQPDWGIPNEGYGFRVVRKKFAKELERRLRAAEQRAETAVKENKLATEWAHREATARFEADKRAESAERDCDDYRATAAQNLALLDEARARLSPAALRAALTDDVLCAAINDWDENGSECARTGIIRAITGGDHV